MPTQTLNPRQARFAAEYLVDLNGTRAAIAAGYSAAGAAVTASKLLINTKVSAVVRREQEQDARRLQMRREEVVAMLLAAFETARERAEPAAMVSAARELGRMMGFYAPARVKAQVDVAKLAARDQFERMSDAELLALVGAEYQR